MENNRANQKNPNNYRSAGYSQKPLGSYGSSSQKSTMTKDQQDFRSKQLNPNNKEYWNSRKN